MHVHMYIHARMADFTRKKINWQKPSVRKPKHQTYRLEKVNCINYA